MEAPSAGESEDGYGDFTSRRTDLGLASFQIIDFDHGQCSRRLFRRIGIQTDVCVPARGRGIARAEIRKIPIECSGIKGLC